VEEKERRGGSSELDRASWRSVAGWRRTGPLAAPPQAERERESEERGHEAVSSGISFAFRLGLGRQQPDTTVSTGRQGAADSISISSSPCIPPTPSGRVHALTAIFLRARARVRVRGRSLGWKRHPRSAHAMQLGRRRSRTRPGRHEEDGSASGWPARASLQVADESGSRFSAHHPLAAAAADSYYYGAGWGSRSCSCNGLLKFSLKKQLVSI